MLRMIGLIPVLLTVLVAPATAQPVVVEFSGVMSEVTASTLDPSIEVGSTFEGSYTFDPASITSSGPSGFGGTGYAFPPGGTLELALEGIAFASEIIEIVIEDDGPNGDAWGTVTPAPDLPDAVALAVGFTDSRLTRLDSESFFANVALQGWDGASIWFFVPSEPAAVARGRITGIKRDPSSQMVTQKIAVRGDPSASVPSSTYQSFLAGGPGYLDAFGRSVFGANLDYQISGPMELVRQSPGGAGAKIALEGESAPGGGTFDGVIFDQATNAAGDLVFTSCIDGCPSSVALFQQRDGILSRVAESGAAAPGLPGFVFSDFQSPSINLAREIAFGARISGNTAAAAVYVRSDAGYTLLATDGDPAPGTGGGTLAMPGTGSVRLSENGDVAFSASVVGGTASWGLFVHRGSGLEAVALEGDPAPGTSGGIFGAPDLSGIDAQGRVLFSDQLTGGASNQGIFLWHDGVVTPFVVSGDPSPDGGTFGNVGSATITPRGDIAFRGIVGGRAVVYVATSSGMEAVVAAGDSAPGTGGGTFSNPSALSLNESEQLSFHSTISGGTTFSGIFFVPEPSRASMLIAGAIALVAFRRRAG